MLTSVLFLLTAELPLELISSEDLGDFFLKEEDGDLFRPFETRGLWELLVPRELTASGDLGDDLFLVKEEEPETDGDLYRSFEPRGLGNLLCPCALTASGDLGDDFFHVEEEEEPETDGDFETRGLGGRETDDVYLDGTRGDELELGCLAMPTTRGNILCFWTGESAKK